MHHQLEAEGVGQPPNPHTLLRARLELLDLTLTLDPLCL